MKKQNAKHLNRNCPRCQKKMMTSWEGEGAYICLKCYKKVFTDKKQVTIHDDGVSKMVIPFFAKSKAAAIKQAIEEFEVKQINGERYRCTSAEKLGQSHYNVTFERSFILDGAFNGDIAAPQAFFDSETGEKL